MSARRWMWLFWVGMAPGLYGSDREVLEIPYSKQYRAYSCGHNSLRMVLGYWGMRLSRPKIIQYLGVGGSNGETMEKFVHDHLGSEFEFNYMEAKPAAIEKEIERHRPVMVGVDASKLTYLDYESASGHFIVVVGFDSKKKEFYLRDPNSKYVETMSYQALEKAWRGRKNTAFTISRRDDRFVAEKDIDHFDDAKPLGADKKKESGIPLSWLLPNIHLVARADGGRSLDKSFSDTKVEDMYFYHLMYQGLHFGDTTLEGSSFLGEGKSFQTLGFHFSYVFGINKLRLGYGEWQSPGTYAFARQRTLDVHNFSSTKSIAAMNLPEIAIDASAIRKFDNEEDLDYADLGFKATEWGGARVGIRRGLGQVLGTASLGVRYVETELQVGKASGDTYTVAVPLKGFDVTLGPLGGSYEIFKSEEGRSEADLSAEDNLELESGSMRFDLNLGGIRSSLKLLEILNYVGIFRVHFGYHFETVRRISSVDSSSIAYHSERSWDTELPVGLHFVDMIYGFSQTHFETREDSSYGRSAWIKFLYNNFMPFMQLQLGYRVQWQEKDHADAQALMGGLYIGT